MQENLAVKHISYPCITYVGNRSLGPMLKVCVALQTLPHVQHPYYTQWGKQTDYGRAKG